MGQLAWGFASYVGAELTGMTETVDWVLVQRRAALQRGKEWTVLNGGCLTVPDRLNELPQSRGRVFQG